AAAARRVRFSRRVDQSVPARALMPGDDDERLPIDPDSGAPLSPRAQPGYYPGFTTLGQQSFWDAATRRVVLGRVQEVPPIRFFSPAEAELMQAVLAR